MAALAVPPSMGTSRTPLPDFPQYNHLVALLLLSLSKHSMIITILSSSSILLIASPTSVNHHHHQHLSTSPLSIIKHRSIIDTMRGFACLLLLPTSAFGLPVPSLHSTISEVAVPTESHNSRGVPFNVVGGGWAVTHDIAGNNGKRMASRALGQSVKESRQLSAGAVTLINNVLLFKDKGKDKASHE